MLKNKQCYRTIVVRVLNCKITKILRIALQNSEMVDARNKLLYCEFYIGQTQKNLITRLNDHNPAISTSNDTDVTKHLRQNPDHHINFNNPIFLSHVSNWRKLLIKETLLTQEKQP